MSHGMRIWGATGNLQIDENSFTVMVVYSAVVSSASGGRSLSITIAGVTPETHSAVCIPIGAYPQDQNAQDYRAVQYEPQVVSGGVVVWFGNRTQSSGVIGLAPQRLLVMRYK